MASQTSASRRDRDVVSRNYEVVCTKVMELNMEICRSYYIGGSDPLLEKAEEIYLLRGDKLLRGDSYIGGGDRGESWR